MEWCSNPTGGILGVPCPTYCAGASKTTCASGQTFQVYVCKYGGYIEYSEGYQS